MWHSVDGLNNMTWMRLLTITFFGMKPENSQAGYKFLVGRKNPSWEGCCEKVNCKIFFHRELKIISKSK